uniref:BCL2L9 n=1 Tax=Paracentrotus lividus TaxID=7656 RepID=A0AAU7NIE0_PARLI
MANLPETPQEFKYETKFVVLNYLGILPKFEEIGDESEGESDDRLDDDEAMSFGLGSQSSSRDTPSSIDSGSSRDSEEFRQIRRIAAAAIAPRPSSPPYHPSHVPLQLSQDEGLQVDAVGEDTLEGFTLPTDDLVTDAVSSNSSSASSSKFGASPPNFTSRMPSLKVSLAESPRSRRSNFKKKRSKDISLDEGTKAKMTVVLSELESQFKQEMVQDGMDSAGVLCAISREALVAERIAQIGDCIMMHHHDELEQAYQQVLAHGDGSMNYGIFKAGMKSMVKNTVPGWYHVAVMMKFTRRMAVKAIDQGSRGIAAVTDFAAQYIEENLAQSIIEQGGWDAITNVDLDKIDSETWSEISSRNPSPQGAQSPSHTTPPLYMDQDGFLSPRQTQSGASSGPADQSQLPGLNDASNIKLDMEGGTSGQPVRDESDSVASAVQRPTGLLVDGSTTQTLRDISPGSRRRYLSERAQETSSPLEDLDDSPRRRSASFGAGPIIATAAAATATVAAVAAVGAYALLKK